jgi:hypothetical protein
MEKLRLIQAALKAPKNQFNKFGGYKYRSTEDILEAVKPLLSEHECSVTITDEIVLIGERYYVRATAVFFDKNTTTSVSAYAREAETKKGMDESQITGAASSYARKYALNGLFLIDDAKDSDSTNTHGRDEKEKTDPAVFDEWLDVLEEKKSKITDSRYKGLKFWLESRDETNLNRAINYINSI